MECDLDCSIRPEMVAVLSVTFREPMPNSSPDLTDKVEAALLSQMSEIANQAAMAYPSAVRQCCWKAAMASAAGAVWSRRRVRSNLHALRYFAVSWRLLKQRPQILQLVE
jgi:hypothetical protein